MCLGAGLGLAATAPLSQFLPALVAATAFAFVLPFGLLELRRKTTNSSPAAVGLWFAFLGGMSSVGMTWFAGSSSPFSNVAVTSGTTGVFGMSICLIGVGIGRAPYMERVGGTLIDRGLLSAVLVCAGAALGIAGSRPVFFFPFSLLSLTGFTLVMLFGVRLFRRGAENRVISAATLYFAVVGTADIAFFLPYLVRYGSADFWLFYARPMGALIVAAGAIMQLRRAAK